MIAAVALGSNLSSRWGDSQATLTEAVRRMEKLGAVKAVSTMRLTEPVGYQDQPHFVNGALLLDTKHTPIELMQALLAVEREMGRVREGGAAKGPRVIDLDLLLYDGSVLSTNELSLPHPAMHTRAFVLEPMTEIAPDLMHPVFGKTMKELLRELQDRSEPQ